MTKAEHDRLDRATIHRCTETSITNQRDVLMTCKTCGAPFFAGYRTAATRRYCTLSCGTKDWRDRRPGWERAYQRAYRARRRAA